MALTLVFSKIHYVCGFSLGLWERWRDIMRFSDDSNNLTADVLGNYCNMFKSNLNLNYYFYIF